MPTWKMVKSCATELFMLVSIVAGASSLDGQSTLPGNASTPDAVSPWPAVSFNVAVVDKTGIAQKIDKETFQLFEDGIERPLQIIGSSDSPVSLAFLIDSSRSINKRRPEILSAIDAIIHALPPSSEVMAVSFSYQASVDLPFTPASTVDDSLLNKPQAAGSTALFDAVIATEDYIAANAKNARRALVILSDGEDNSSHVTAEGTGRSIERPGAPIVYSCTVRETRGSFSAFGVSTRGPKILKFLATTGGGRVFDLDSDPAIAASQIAAAIRSQYALQFTTLDSPRNGKAHKLEMRFPSKAVKIYGLTSYFAPQK